MNVRRETIKLLEENIGSMHFDSGLSDIFLDLSPQAREAKVKNEQVGLNQTKKFLNSQGNYQQNEKTTYQMGEDIYKPYIQ